MPVPDPKSLKLKTRAEYRLIGKRYRGVDDPKVVTGQPLFGIDVQLPGMVYANYTKCPAAGGKVASFNVDEIKAQRGVLDAFALDGTGVPAEVMPGVAIIAKDTWSAFQAKDKLKVEWDLSAASKDSTSQFSARAKAVANDFPQKPDQNVGDVDKSFADAAKIVEAYYEYPFASHAPLEPMNTTAHWHDGVMEMWVPTQQPDRGLPLVAKVAGISAGQDRHAPDPRRRRLRPALGQRLYLRGRRHRAEGQRPGQAAMDAGKTISATISTVPPAIISSRARSTRMAGSTPGGNISSPSPPTARRRPSAPTSPTI